jgi:O-antigen ligase
MNKTVLLLFGAVLLALALGFLVANFTKLTMVIIAGVLFMLLLWMVPYVYFPFFTVLLILISSGSHFPGYLPQLATIRFVPFFILVFRGLIGMLQHSGRSWAGNKPGPIQVGMGIFIVYIFLTSPFSIITSLTLQRGLAYSLLLIGIFFVLWQRIDSIPDIKTALISIKNAILVTNLMGYGYWVINAGAAFRGVRFCGIFVSPNGIGVSSACALPIVLYQLFSTKSPRRKLIYLAQFAAFFLAVFMSGSRAGMLAVAVGISLFVLMVGVARSVVYIFFTLFLIFLVFTADIYEIIKLPSFREDKSLESSVTFDNRREIWDIGWRLFRERPLTGYGFGTYGMSTLILRPDRKSSESGSGFYFHNSYLQFLVDVGLCGVSIIFGTILTIILTGLLLQHTISDEPNRLLAIALLSAFLACCANAFFEAWIQSPASLGAFSFWTIGSFILKMRRLQGEGFRTPSAQPLPSLPAPSLAL